jgi:hypothetical protein
MKMIYRSHRSMGDVAHGLMIGCFRYFEEAVEIERHDLSAGDGSSEQFILTPIPMSMAATATLIPMLER